MHVTPYLSFDGRCEEAAEFYKKALGAQVVMAMRFKESPDATSMPPGTEEKIMHMALQVGDTTLFMSDGHCTGNAKFEGISLALRLASDDEAQRKFAALSEGGQVQMPLTKTFFASQFGMVLDPFGVLWMVITEHSA